MGAFDDVTRQRTKALVEHYLTTAERMFSELGYPRNQWEEGKIERSHLGFRLVEGSDTLVDRGGEIEGVLWLYLGGPQRGPKLRIDAVAGWGAGLTFRCCGNELKEGDDFEEFLLNVRADIEERALRRQ